MKSHSRKRVSRKTNKRSRRRTKNKKRRYKKSHKRSHKQRGGMDTKTALDAFIAYVGSRENEDEVLEKTLESDLFRSSRKNPKFMEALITHYKKPSLIKFADKSLLLNSSIIGLLSTLDEQYNELNKTVNDMDKRGVYQYDWWLRDAPDWIKEDKETVLMIVKKNGEALLYASDTMKNDKEVVMAAVQNKGSALRDASDNLKNDKEVVMAAVRNYSFSLQSASETLRNDKEVVMVAINQDKYAFGAAGNAIKNNKEAVLQVMDIIGPDAYVYFSKRLKQDKELVIRALTEYDDTPDPLDPGQIPPNLLNDPEIAHIIWGQFKSEWIKKHGKELKDLESRSDSLNENEQERLKILQNPSCVYVPHIYNKMFNANIAPDSIPDDSLFISGAPNESFKNKQLFRIGIEVECCGEKNDGKKYDPPPDDERFFSTMDWGVCDQVEDYKGKSDIEPWFNMTSDPTVICEPGQCAGEIVLKNDIELHFDGDTYSTTNTDLPPGGFMEAVTQMGDNFKPTLFGGGRFQVHISGGDDYGTPDGLNFAKTLLCLWAMNREEGRYQEIFDSRGHDDMSSGVGRPKYFNITKGEMDTQFGEENRENYKNFITFVESKLLKGYSYRNHYAGMFFYSFFENVKYYDRDTDPENKPVRLEFRGFHNCLAIAHLLSEAPEGHPRYNQSSGEIFAYYVDTHIKDVHFFFSLAYKTSGKFPEHNTSMRMVRSGKSIQEIIQQVRKEEEAMEQSESEISEE